MIVGVKGRRRPPLSRMCFLVLLPILGVAQETMRITTILPAQNLAGRIHIESPEDEGMKGVLVEDCTAEWKQVLATTSTDEHGYFRFPGRSKSGMHYLRFSGFNLKTQKMRVKITPKGREELSIILRNAT